MRRKRRKALKRSGSAPPSDGHLPRDGRGDPRARRGPAGEAHGDHRTVAAQLAKDALTRPPPSHVRRHAARRRPPLRLWLRFVRGAGRAAGPGSWACVLDRWTSGRSPESSNFAAPGSRASECAISSQICSCTIPGWLTAPSAGPRSYPHRCSARRAEACQNGTSAHDLCHHGTIRRFATRKQEEQTWFDNCKATGMNLLKQFSAPVHGARSALDAVRSNRRTIERSIVGIWTFSFAAHLALNILDASDWPGFLATITWAVSRPLDARSLVASAALLATSDLLGIYAVIAFSERVLQTISESRPEQPRIRKAQGQNQWLELSADGPPPPMSKGLEPRLVGAICQVCGRSDQSSWVLCVRCETPHHQDCWAYMGKCSTYACPELRMIVLPRSGQRRVRASGV